MLNILSALLLSFVFAQEKPIVKSVSPQGFVKSATQIRIEFSHPMVRFGDINLAYPAQSSCFKNGQGRWIDTKNWVFDFNETLAGGSACKIDINGTSYSFNTGGPHVQEFFPRLYRPMDPQQKFVLILDAPIKKETVREGAYFVVEGLGDRIAAEALSDTEAKSILEAAQTEYKYEKESFSKTFVVLKAQRPFPTGAKVSLVWGKKLQSESGYSSPVDEVFEFSIAEPFKADFSCDREAPGKPCIPLGRLSLSFSASIQMKDAKNIYLEASDRKKIQANEIQAESNKERVTYLTFNGPFTANAELKLNIPKDLTDEEGRLLVNQKVFPLTVKFGEFPSLVKFAADFGIIEAGPESALAVTLRQVEKNIPTKTVGWTGKLNPQNFAGLLKSLNEVQRNPYDINRLTSLKSLPVERIQIQKPLKSSEMEVVGIPLKKTGFYVLEMESPLLGQSLLNKKVPYFVRSAALVTNMAVHLKHTSNEVWAWVTDLKSARVLSGATVKIYDLLGNEVARGVSNEKGLAYFSLPKPVEQWPRVNDSYYYDGFFAVAEKGDDFTFTHSSWNSGIESWRYQLGVNEYGSSLIGHAILDRTLFKPEEVVSAKVVLRKSLSKGLALPGEKEWPSTIEFSHSSGLQSFKLPVQWNKNSGTANLKWPLPAGVKMGQWRMALLKSPPESPIDVGEFSVESFRVPLIQVRLSAATPNFVLENKIPIETSGSFFAGGPAAQLPMKMRWSVEPANFYPQDDDFADYSFANGTVKEGLFRSGEDDGARYIPQSGVNEFKLDQMGSSRTNLQGIKYGSSPQRLRTEVEFKDPNGEVQSAIRSFFLWPSSVVLGVKAKSWSATPDLVEFDVVAMDLQQKPLSSQKIQVDLFTSNYFSHRKRLVGGFYAYEDFRQFKKLGPLCRGETKANGVFNCVGKSPVTGSVLAVVTTSDSKGRLSSANVNQWIVKKGSQQWFGSGDNDRVDLIPFKKRYEPGEVAEFQLRTPFPQAKVLVTVERESVLYSEVVDVSSDQPVIRIPIKKEFAPNVVVSAFAIRGRLQDPKPTAIVDLGKPAFKLGMTQIKVGWKENTLKVSVNTDRKKYKAREKALVSVSVKNPDGSVAKNAEIALVAVDEGLLELRDNSSWDLLSAMMTARPHFVRTATAQAWLVGRRHFGLKALPVGGDGGGGIRRELFDSLLYWNPLIKLNAQGEAKVEVPLNDLTTSFRIVAIAQQNADQFGSGWTSIQSSQDVMILPGLSGVAREGDEFFAGFTVRNASAVPQKLEVSLSTNPSISNLAAKKIELAPGMSEELHWKIKIPSVEKVEYIVTARGPQGQRLDEIKKIQKILPLRGARIYQSEWGNISEFSKILLKQPPGAELQKSSIFVELSENLGGTQAGIQEFWKNYPYTCLEQEVSRAVSTRDEKLWKRLEQKLSTYMDSNGLLSYFPSSQAKGNVVLTAYVLGIAHEAGLQFSEENENRLLNALNSYSQGSLREDVTQGRADETLKKITAFEVLSRYRRLNIDVLTSIDFAPTQWPLYSLVEWYQIHLWEKNIPDREKKLSQLEAIVRNQFYFSAKRLQLKDEKRESMPWLMRDSEGAALRLILATLNLPSWRNDVPRMYQGILSRQHQGSWYLTSDNAWGSIVIDKMKKVYAQEKVTGSIAVQLDEKTKTYDWKKGPMTQFEIPWNQKESAMKWTQQGSGKPWITISTKISMPVTQPTFAGFKVEKNVTPIEQKKKGIWSVGDVAKIQLKVQPQAPQSWVVVEDPIPASASILQSSWSTAIEKKEHLIRYYFSWFVGDETIEYTLRFNQAGTYQLPASRVEAMYSPDLFAELPESSWQVVE